MRAGMSMCQTRGVQRGSYREKQPGPACLNPALAPSNRGNPLGAPRLPQSSRLAASLQTLLLEPRFWAAFM